jgi:hypothetical protein
MTGPDLPPWVTGAPTFAGAGSYDPEDHECPTEEHPTGGGWCPVCQRDYPCSYCGRIPRPGEDHAREVRAGEEDDDVEIVCTAADGRPVTFVHPPIPDPWGHNGEDEEPEPPALCRSCGDPAHGSSCPARSAATGHPCPCTVENGHLPIPDPWAQQGPVPEPPF